MFNLVYVFRLTQVVSWGLVITVKPGTKASVVFGGHLACFGAHSALFSAIFLWIVASRADVVHSSLTTLTHHSPLHH